MGLEVANAHMFRTVFEVRLPEGVDPLKFACSQSGIDKRVMKKIREGRQVSYEILEHLANCTRTKVGDWILNDVRTALPLEPAYYESLCRSYYLDHNRDGDGELQFREEKVTVRIIRKSLGGTVPGKLRFVGTLEGWPEKYFRYVASKANDYYLGLVAHNVKDPNLAFHSVFGHLVDEVLCGLWVGLTLKGNQMAAYRMFLSPRVLDRHDLDQLTVAAPTLKFVQRTVPQGSPLIRFDGQQTP